GAGGVDTEAAELGGVLLPGALRIVGQEQHLLAPRRSVSTASSAPGTSASPTHTTPSRSIRNPSKSSMTAIARTQVRPPDRPGLHRVVPRGAIEGRPEGHG